MKVMVDKDACIGCSNCWNIADKVFEEDENGLSKVIEDADVDASEDDVRTAIDSCPTNAIHSVDTEDEK